MSLRKFLDKIEHNFEQGGKYEKWYALYEAVDTFFYRPGSVTKSTAHVRDGIDLKGGYTEVPDGWPRPPA